MLSPPLRLGVTCALCRQKAGRAPVSRGWPRASPASVSDPADTSRNVVPWSRYEERERGRGHLPVRERRVGEKTIGSRRRDRLTASVASDGAPCAREMSALADKSINKSANSHASSLPDRGRDAERDWGTFSVLLSSPFLSPAFLYFSSLTFLFLSSRPVELGS